MQEESIQSSYEGLRATRFLTAAGLTILLYDHSLTFEKERRYIWTLRPLLVKWALLVNRYLVPIALIINAHALSGLSTTWLSNDFCQSWWLIISSIIIASIGICHGILIYKLWVLWDASKKARRTLMIAYILTEIASMVAVAKTVVEMWPYAIFFVEMRSCALTQTPPTLKIVWAFLVTFELFTFFMVFFNALSRPRAGNSHLLKILIRDGINFFMVISVLGWLNLIAAVTQPPSKSEIGLFCIWAMCVTMLTRMMINLREVEEENLIPYDAISLASNSDEEEWNFRTTPVPRRMYW